MDLTERNQDTLRVMDNDDSSDTNTVVNNDELQLQNQEMENVDTMALPTQLPQDDASPINEENDLRTNEDTDSLAEDGTRPGSRRIPEREMRSLSSVNRPGFSEQEANKHRLT